MSPSAISMKKTVTYITSTSWSSGIKIRTTSESGGKFSEVKDCFPFLVVLAHLLLFFSKLVQEIASSI